MRYIALPKVQIIGILLLFFTIVAPQVGIATALFLLAACVGFASLLDIIFTYIRIRKYSNPFGAIVTGLILALIIDPSANWFQIFVVCAAAMGIKNFVRFGNRHVFNPAASGLFAGWAFFGMNSSWWGATLYSGEKALIMNTLMYILLIGIAYISCIKLSRYLIVLSYILIFSVLFLFATSSYSVDVFVKTIASFGMHFYAVLMLPEPMTSPANKKRQLMYGSVVAGIQAFFVYISFTMGITNIPDASIAALLIGNMLFFKLR